jgi:hypothetical protein
MGVAVDVATEVARYAMSTAFPHSGTKIRTFGFAGDDDDDDDACCFTAAASQVSDDGNKAVAWFVKTGLTSER